MTTGDEYPRVKVEIPGPKPFVRFGERRGEHVSTADGTWIGVRLDGHTTTVWYRSQYVSSSTHSSAQEVS